MKHRNLINDGSSVYGLATRQSGGGRCQGEVKEGDLVVGKKGVLKKEKRATKRSQY
jgi:hypothetical protein